MPYTYTEQLQRIANQYLREHGGEATTKRDIAVWAVSSGLWQPQRSDLISQCAEQLARAMREEYITDPQGRSVRAKHVARIEQGGEQLYLWADIRTAPAQHMQIAFMQRRQQIVGECRQLKSDVDSYNENRKPEKPIQMTMNFTVDLLELEAAAQVAY